MEKREEAMRHLGNVLAFFAELHPDDRCEAFEKALEFYNDHNPDRQVRPEPGFETRLVLTGPLDRALAALPTTGE